MLTFLLKQKNKIHFVPVLTLIILFFGLSTSTNAEIEAKLSDGETLKLIGIGIHQELRNDIYLGALFGPSSVSSVDQLMNDNVAKRMSIRFLSQYSNRKMARHWKERLAMNNPRSQWQPLTREIIKFSRTFKRNFQSGDELNIDHVPGKGAQIYLNGTLFKTIQKPIFSNLLLNVWLGTNPPTKAFKSSIRGQDSESIKQDYISQYSSLEAVVGRFDADLKQPTKIAGVEKQQPKKATQAAERKKESTTSDTTTNNPTSKAATEENRSIAQISEPSKNENINMPPAAPQTTNNQTADNNEQAETLPQVDTSNPKQMKLANLDTDKLKTDLAEASLLEADDNTAQVESSSESFDEEEDFFDADLASGSYTKDLIEAIKQYQQYPRKAAAKGEQGNVTAKVIISANGEIKDIELIERSGSRILDRAVIKMVKKASPFNAIPSELNLQEFEFEFPVSFQL